MLFLRSLYVGAAKAAFVNEKFFFLYIYLSTFTWS